MDVQSKKTFLREHFLDLRETIDPEIKQRHDTAIGAALLCIADALCVKGVLIFVSVGNEVDTKVAIAELLKKGVRVAVPKCVGPGNMQFFEITGLESLKPGKHNIPEPEGGTPVNPDEFKLCVVPALSIDKSGIRLGYGGGYYDRFLKHYNGITAGLCYEDFCHTRLPSDHFDRSVDIIITELGVKTVVR